MKAVYQPNSLLLKKEFSKPIVLIFLFLGLMQIGWAQGVNGKIKNEKGEALAYATIFVKENGTGAISNVNGNYVLNLSAGKYTLIFQYLGYETLIREVSIGNQMQKIDITLIKQSIDLKEVEVYEGREDPAYTVMRKAIAKASFHRQQINKYSAQVYIKGSGRLKKYPKLLKPFIDDEDIDTTVAYTTESVSEIEYIRPNKFTEKVISIYETGESNSTSPNGYLNGSFYEPKLGGAISPLSPQAFAYYKFKLDGYFYDRGYAINKIRVTPRSRGENVFEGHIYILDDYWSIYSTTLKTYKFGIEFNIDQVYAPIEDKAWLPVSHKFIVNGKIFGFAFVYNYLATVSNYQIEINPDLKDDFVVVDEKIDKDLAKSVESANKEKPSALEEQLASGKEVTRKELRKIIKEYEKEERKKQDEPEVVEEVNFTIDSMARKRDSIYWENIRPVPLTELEVRGYIKEDSLAKAEKEAKENNDDEIDEKRRGNRWSPTHLWTGNRYKLADKEYISWGSSWDKILFNPVEGFSYHNHLTYYRYKGNRLTIRATPRYAFSREKLTGKGLIKYELGERLKRTTFSLEGGRYIYQYNEQKPIDPYISAFINLFQEKNYIHLYEKDYLRFDFKKAFQENLQVAFKAEWADRNTLRNTTTQTWFGREERSYEANVPFNAETPLPLFEQQKAMVFSAKLITKPWQKYRIRNDKKIPINNSSPLLEFSYTKGIPGVSDSQSNFDQIDVTYKHKFRLGVSGLVNFKANAGAFINNSNMGFVDFKHFMGNQIALVTADPVGSFRVLPYYEYSTKEEYASLHLHYQFRKLLLTRIPELWLVGIKENLFVNYLATPKSQNYYELGYSLDNILRVFRIEAAASFQNGKYRDFGILVGVASNFEDLFD